MVIGFPLSLRFSQSKARRVRIASQALRVTSTRVELLLIMVPSPRNKQASSHDKHRLVRLGRSEYPLFVVGAVVATGVQDFFLPTSTEQNTRAQRRTNRGGVGGPFLLTNQRVHIK